VDKGSAVLQSAASGVVSGRTGFDTLVVGAGFAGSVLAERLANVLGQRVLVVDRRPHIGGNAYDRHDDAGILVHPYGPHIFHTNSAEIFDYLSQFTEWRPYQHRVLASVDGQLLPMPINLDTINRLYGMSMSSFEVEAFFASVAEKRDPIRTSEDVVVNKVNGDVATRYSFRDRKIDVLVRARESDRASVDSIRHLIVNAGNGRPVTLESVADVISTTGPSEIHRADQVRVAVVSANLRDIDLGGAVQEVRDMVAAHPLGADIGMHIGGQGEELSESVKSLLFAFGLAIFLVYLVMASQFESLLHPFVILFTIPLALVGAVLALFLTGSTVSVVVFIGLILLVGLVVKNAIILIDKVNQLREQGVAKREALVEGARSRLRPIIMTTMCTLFGFLPLAIATGEGAEVRSPMAITVIGGLLVSTLLTLVVIPVVYDLLDRRADEYYRERGKRARRDGAAVAAGIRSEQAPLTDAGQA